MAHILSVKLVQTMFGDHNQTFTLSTRTKHQKFTRRKTSSKLAAKFTRQTLEKTLPRFNLKSNLHKQKSQCSTPRPKFSVRKSLKQIFPNSTQLTRPLSNLKIEFRKHRTHQTYLSVAVSFVHRRYLTLRSESI